jgi:hypothetical protein
MTAEAEKPTIECPPIKFCPWVGLREGNVDGRIWNDFEIQM